MYIYVYIHIHICINIYTLIDVALIYFVRNSLVVLLEALCAQM